MRSDDRGRKIKLNLAFPRTERGPGRNRDTYKNSTTRRNFGNDDSYIWASLYPRANHLRSYVNPRSLRDFSHFYDNTSPLSLSLYLLFRVLLLFLPFFFRGIVLGNIEVLSPPSIPYVFFHESIYSEKGGVYIYIYTRSRRGNFPFQEYDSCNQNRFSWLLAG